MTVERIEYKNSEPGDDIYVHVSLNEKTYYFLVERYLTGPETEVYKTAQSLKKGDKIDMEGFLCWYMDPLLHITSVKVLPK